MDIPSTPTEGEQAFNHWSAQAQALASNPDPRYSAGLLPSTRPPWAAPMPAPLAPEPTAPEPAPTADVLAIPESDYRAILAARAELDEFRRVEAERTARAEADALRALAARSGSDAALRAARESEQARLRDADARLDDLKSRYLGETKSNALAGLTGGATWLSDEARRDALAKLGDRFEARASADGSITLDVPSRRRGRAGVAEIVRVRLSPVSDRPGRCPDRQLDALPGGGSTGGRVRRAFEPRSGCVRALRGRGRGAAAIRVQPRHRNPRTGGLPTDVGHQLLCLSQPHQSRHSPRPMNRTQRKDPCHECPDSQWLDRI
jgi:multidrug efflux pump subunit AcrA (membrane-fusion protein)